MAAILVPGPPLDNPLECVEVDTAAYTLDTNTGTAIGTGATATLTLPVAPFPGVPYTVVADGGIVTVHGGTYPIQGGDPVTIAQGKLSIFIWSDISKKWSVGGCPAAPPPS